MVPKRKLSVPLPQTLRHRTAVAIVVVQYLALCPPWLPSPSDTLSQNLRPYPATDRQLYVQSYPVPVPVQKQTNKTPSSTL